MPAAVNKAGSSSTYTHTGTPSPSSLGAVKKQRAAIRRVSRGGPHPGSWSPHAPTTSVVCLLNVLIVAALMLGVIYLIVY